MIYNTKKNKLIEIIKKNYIYINITILLLLIYVILFPLISDFLAPIFPNLFDCVYLKTTGKPCPLCGGTRYIKNLYKVTEDITYLFNPFGIMVLFIVFETIYRVYNIMTLKKEKSMKYIKIDIIIHTIALICFFIYEGVFIILQYI